MSLMDRIGDVDLVSQTVDVQAGVRGGRLAEALAAAWQDAAHRWASPGGTITHHHGVGRLKAGLLTAGLGAAGTRVLDRIRAAVDLAGIMNPANLRP